MSFPRPRTIRAKLTLMTTAVMALVLFALGMLVDFGTGRTLMGSIDTELARRGGDFVRGRLEHRFGPGRPGDGRPGDGPRPGGAGGTSLQLPEGAGMGGGGGAFGMFDGPGGPGPGPFGRRPNGQDDSRPRFIQPIPKPGEPEIGPRDVALDPDAVKRLQNRKGQLWTTVTRSGGPFRVYSESVMDGRRVDGVVQVGYPIGDVEDSLAGLRRLLLTVMVPLGALLAGLASLFLVARMLRPLRTITENAQTIGGGNLEGRLPVVGDDEFASLATTLNGMLARLEEAFRLEQATTRRLRETVEQQRRFTADASHELKTPLATVKAHAGLLGHLTEEDDRESVDAIGEAADRMTGLVNDLLVLARADGGSLVSKTAPVDLAEAVNSAICAVGIRNVEVRASSRPLVVNGNGEALTRIFINLLDNAKKYAGTEAPVEIAFAKRGDTAEVAVIDRGVGIPAEHLPRLFDRFYRPDTSRTSETGGTGLGLAICREIAAAHGGSIEVASVVGKGTTFTVVLPLA